MAIFDVNQPPQGMGTNMILAEAIRGLTQGMKSGMEISAERRRLNMAEDAMRKQADEKAEQKEKALAYQRMMESVGKKFKENPALVKQLSANPEQTISFYADEAKQAGLPYTSEDIKAGMAQFFDVQKKMGEVQEEQERKAANVWINENLLSTESENIFSLIDKDPTFAQRAIAIAQKAGNKGMVDTINAYSAKIQRTPEERAGKESLEKFLVSSFGANVEADDVDGALALLEEKALAKAMSGNPEDEKFAQVYASKLVRAGQKEVANQIWAHLERDDKVAQAARDRKDIFDNQKKLAKYTHDLAMKLLDRKDAKEAAGTTAKDAKQNAANAEAVAKDFVTFIKGEEKLTDDPNFSLDRASDIFLEERASGVDPLKAKTRTVVRYSKELKYLSGRVFVKDEDLDKEARPRTTGVKASTSFPSEPAKAKLLTLGQQKVPKELQAKFAEAVKAVKEQDVSGVDADLIIQRFISDHKR